jgi:hypothetical protein
VWFDWNCDCPGTEPEKRKSTLEHRRYPKQQKPTQKKTRPFPHNQNPPKKNPLCNLLDQKEPKDHKILQKVYSEFS